MFLSFFLFEIKLRLRRVSTYVYFGLFFLVTFLCVSVSDFGPMPTGKVFINGPYALMMYFGQLTAFGSLIVSAIFGTSILRDFQQDTYQLVFTRPVSKLAYLGGRWAGSMVVTTLCFSGLMMGCMLGALMPWADTERLAPVNLWWHLQTFLSVTVVEIFFLGCIFFMVAALSRRLVVVYVQGVALFAIYMIAGIYTLSQRTADPFWPSVFDPLGMVLMTTTTRYWTVAEQNSQLLSWSGAFLYNRLFWIGIGLACLACTFLFFPMSAEALTAGRRLRRAGRRESGDIAEEQPVQHQGRLRLPAVSRHFGGAATWLQLSSLTRLRFWNIVREIPFWAIALLMVVLTVLDAKEAGRIRGTPVWPVTYLMTQVLHDSSALFLFIVATLYAGELIWRERDVRFDQIHDSMPLPTWANWVTQFVSLALVELLLITAVMICGIGVQAFLGYHRFEIALYFKELYVVVYPGILAYLMFALFVQTAVSNKFIGHGIVIGANLLVPMLEHFGVENRLLLFGETAPYTYSDMNGYGHFVPAILWSNVYWFFWMASLAVVSIALARRGTELGWRTRWQEGRINLRRLAIPAVICASITAASGGWYYYNGHVLNEFRTSKQARELQAGYERNFKRYEKLPQPKITAVDTIVDLNPEHRSFSARGFYTLVNHTNVPIAEIYVSDPQEALDEVRFDHPFHAELSGDKRRFFSIYKLERPLGSGEVMRMDFRISSLSRGFKDGNERPEFAYNGTFFDRDYFPSLGYSSNAEIVDPVRRREEKLPPRAPEASPGDPYYRNVNLLTPDSEPITFHAIVSTSPDQIAIAPGYLKREWTDHDRHFYEYETGSSRINNFFSFISARYAVKREQYGYVKIEIYYQPGHEYNLERMLTSTKKGLDYYQRAFGPFQFRQFRILEFPRYRAFAQSFPNTIPYSEQLGFIQRREKADDLDMVFYVTAHELAHQWWGHQIVGSATLGSNMMSETLAQYSALMLMEKEYGAESLRKFLKHELDGYLRGRGREIRGEPPLMLVERQPYVYYNKGSVVMYALKDYIGEERLNGALRGFLEQHKLGTTPLPDSRMFVEALRAATPAPMQYLITDMFERIVLFDNKAVAASYTPLPDKQYRVELTVDARKMTVDGLGNEAEIPINDLVDIGVFKGAKGSEKPLYLAKHHITARTTKITVMVGERPTRAGVDPYNKLIDRKPDDNIIDASKL